MARSELSAALARLPDTAPGAVQVFSISARLGRKRTRDFVRALAALAAEFEAASEEEGTALRMTLALFPGEDSTLPDDARVVLATKADQ